jgi:hypothetical protein
MLLGDVIARFEDPVVAGEILLALDDLALTARLAAAADEQHLTPGEFAMETVGRFVNGANDEEWLTLIGQISRAGDPGVAFIRHVLSRALPPPAAA